MRYCTLGSLVLGRLRGSNMEENRRTTSPLWPGCPGSPSFPGGPWRESEKEREVEGDEDKENGEKEIERERVRGYKNPAKKIKTE